MRLKEAEASYGCPSREEFWASSGLWYNPLASGRDRLWSHPAMPCLTLPRRMRRGVLSALLLLLAPVAHATPVSGTIVVPFAADGSITVPDPFNGDPDPGDLVSTNVGTIPDSGFRTWRFPFVESATGGSRTEVTLTVTWFNPLPPGPDSQPITFVELFGGFINPATDVFSPGGGVTFDAALCSSLGGPGCGFATLDGNMGISFDNPDFGLFALDANIEPGSSATIQFDVDVPANSSFGNASE